MVSITAAAATVGLSAREFEHGPELLAVHRDLAEAFGLSIDEELLRAGANVSHRDLLDDLVECHDLQDVQPDLIIVAHALPDIHPFFASASYLNERFGGRALSFAVIEQGLSAPFTAMRIASAFHASGRSRLSMLAVLEQTTLPTRMPFVHDEHLVDSGALLLLGDDPGLRVIRLTTVLPGESLRARVGELVDDPVHTLVVAGARVDVTALPDGVAVRRCDPSTYCTSVWVDLAQHRAAWQLEYAAIVLCDTEPRSGRTQLALLSLAHH